MESTELILVRQLTWITPINQNLFDFQTRHVKQNQTILEINNYDFFLEDLNNNLVYLSDDEKNQNNNKKQNKISEKAHSKYICSFKKLNKEIFLKELDQDCFKQIYCVCKTKEKIQVGDIIKLGSCLGFILEEKHSKSNYQEIINSNQILANFLNYFQGQISVNKNLNLEEEKINLIENKSESLNNQTNQLLITQQTNQANVCRVCLGEANQLNGPLHQLPCKCKGTQGYIHQSCFTQLLSTRFKIIILNEKSNTNCISYKISKVICEICKKKIPEQFLLQFYGKILEKLPRKPNNDDYLIITFFQQKKSQELHNLGIFAIPSNQNSNCYIGRKQNFTHLQLKDRSISRLHCEISCENNEFFIQDKNSRFGTMKAVKFPISAIDNAKILQINNSILGINQIKRQHQEETEK